MLNKQERQFKSVIVTFVINFKFIYVIMLVKINNFCPYPRVAKLYGIYKRQRQQKMDQ